MTRRQARVSVALTGVFLLLALALGIAPPRLKLPALSPLPPVDAARTVPAAAPAMDMDAYQDVVEGNILSPDRRAPALPSLSSQRAVPGSGGQRSRTYRLSGIVRGPEGIIALIDADPRIPGAELYRLGDRVGQYRIEEATDSVIVLRGALGTQVLKLASLPRRAP